MGWSTNTCDQVWYKIGFSPNLLVELWVAKILGETQSSLIFLKLIARPINIGCKSSNFIIIIRRVQSLKQPMVRATCFSFYINFTRANLCRVSIEQNYTACVSTPLQCERAQINAPAILQETWHVHACIHVYLFFTCKPLPHQAPVQLSAFHKGSRNNTRWYMKSMITKGVNSNSCFV